jgi:GNAT superfamily N-acetyltransferase
VGADSLAVTPVRGLGDRRAFVELPFRLHSSSPVWVPPLRLERHLYLNRHYNAFFSKGDAQLFLARRGGRVVGRLSAQYDDLFNAHHGTRWGMFGFLELEEDPEVLPALLAAAEAWLRGRGCDRMVGPMDFSMNDESGVLIEGFERPPLIKMPWHPPYYRRLCEEAGLTKAMDLFMWELVISDREKILPVIFKLADELEPRHGITLRHMTRRSLRRDMDRFADVYNSAWSENWDFTPYTNKTLAFLAGELQLVFDPDWMMVAETPDGDTAAIAITTPDINQVLRRMNGRLLPVGWWHFLRRHKIMDRVRVGFLGVKPAYQHTGVAAKLYVEHFDRSAATQIKWGEMGWILETNRNMNRAMEAMGGRIVRRFRMYERVWDPPADGGSSA